MIQKISNEDKQRIVNAYINLDLHDVVKKDMSGSLIDLETQYCMVSQYIAEQLTKKVKL